ncbi:COX15/CtaA family protein [Adhaeribacter swui]|uniref:COX15/CtaA family protein n=1 Tax=Adhaeribacter swui TaxID=2086471 RepID=A0A7G7G8I5_9BACT|nr:COX15/CtaA family protein [Adhaeribacter swui]QNF33469.1 COX15/CtaA family protein [Adhaeribacter swui]
MSNKSFSSKRFRNIGVLTIASVYFLILVGGVVRSTGSGMGCPDWPKCFGSWVPPTNVSQLPTNYLEVYKNKRIQKNEKLAGFLKNLGFTQVAENIFQHPSQYLETEFNVTKTWIEYLNRLVGVLIGIFIFLTLIYSFPYLKKDPVIFYLSLFSFVLVGFQGWLGSLVVSTNLLPITVTIHMALALVLVALLIYAVARSQKSAFHQLHQEASNKVYSTFYFVIALSFAQILLGTQVRELVDIIASELNYTGRDIWISKIGTTFYIHRTFSAFIFVVNVYLCWQLYALHDARLSRLANGLLACMGVEILVGIIISYFDIPAALQPIHLVLATIVFGLQFYMLIVYYYAAHNRVLKLAVR